MSIIEKEHRKMFKESKAPRVLVANLYKKGSTWRTIDWANNNDKSIVSKLSTTVLKNEEYTVEKKSGSSGYTVIISWKNSNGVVLGCSLQFDNEKEFNKEGWE